MANIFRRIIENDKGELRRLEKMAKKVIAYEDERRMNLSNGIKMASH